MSTDPQIAGLALARIPGVGPMQWTRLLQAFETPAAVLQDPLPVSRLRALGVSRNLEAALARAPWAAAEADARWAQADDGRRIVLRAPLPVPEPAYPERLLEIADPPNRLFVDGDTAAIHAPQVAIIGSRSASPGARSFAADLAAGLVRHGFTVTSGLAAGIDTAAHRGALEAGGRTVAVLATGPDRVYPAANASLARAIRDNGAVVTEQPPGVGPASGLFPRRNRIVSGLSLGVVVVEASRRSGALITARLAAEQGREVFAVPGSVHEPRARGCHRLIRQGARLVEGLDDLLEELPVPERFDAGDALPGTAADPRPETGAKSACMLDSAESLVLTHLDYTPVTVDVLALRSGLTTSSLSSILLATELKGLVTALPGGRYVRSTPGADRPWDGA